MEIAPSIWPIVFSSVLGNALRGYADWKVERGIQLMVNCRIYLSEWALMSAAGSRAAYGLTHGTFRVGTARKVLIGIRWPDL